MTEENQQEISVYDYVKSSDILDMLSPLIDGGQYKLREIDGKLVPILTQISRNNPWIHVKQATGLKCGLWHIITFNVVASKLPKGHQFVPRRCQNCWKVVVKPRTLQQLFSVLEMEKKLDRPSKCGIELRDTVPGLYGAYFYNTGIKAGLECYDVVRNALLKNEILAPLVSEVDNNGRTTRIILKRACTEFEVLVGPSDKWEITEEQNYLEDLIEEYVVDNGVVPVQPEHVMYSIQRRWIEWAWKNGDPTYALYTGGKPISPAYVTYHQSELLKETEKKAETRSNKVKK